MFFPVYLIALLGAGLGAIAQGVGQGTFFHPATGSCGHFNTDADFIVAVAANLFDTFPGAGANPNLNPICGKPLTITFEGKTVQATVTDRCGDCVGNDLDLTPAAFNTIADPSRGRISGLSWAFN